MKIFTALFVMFFALCAVPAAAQQKEAVQSLPVATDSKQPLEITADDTLEWHRNDKTFIARKNALAVQGEVSIAAQTLTALYREGQTKKTEIYQLNADEGVLISSRETKAYGDHAVYDLDKGLATMTGEDLRLISPDQTVTAKDRFEYWIADGRLVAIGNAHVIRAQDTLDADQVSAVFMEDAQGKRVLKTLEATGNVVIITQTETLKGDYGIYTAETNMAELKGNVTITRDKNILEGDRAEVDLNTDISRMYGSEAGGRVRGIFYPGSEEKPEPEAPPAPVAAPAP